MHAVAAEFEFPPSNIRLPRNTGPCVAQNVPISAKKLVTFSLLHTEIICPPYYTKNVTVGAMIRAAVFVVLTELQRCFSGGCVATPIDAKW